MILPKRPRNGVCGLFVHTVASVEHILGIYVGNYWILTEIFASDVRPYVTDSRN